MAMEPTAVTSHESREIAPNWPILAGNMMMPDPIIFTATNVVSPMRLIFLSLFAIVNSSLRRYNAIFTV